MYNVLFKTCKYGRRWMNVERYSRLPCLDCAQTSLTSHIPNLDVKKDQNMIHWSRPCDQSFLSTLTTPSVQPVRRRDPGWSRQQRRNWRCSRKTITLVEIKCIGCWNSNQGMTDYWSSIHISPCLPRGSPSIKEPDRPISKTCRKNRFAPLPARFQR